MVNKGAALLGRHVTHLTPSHFSTVVYTTGGKVDQLLGQGALGMEFQALGRRGGAQFAALWADRVCGAGLGRRRLRGLEGDGCGVSADVADEVGAGVGPEGVVGICWGKWSSSN